MSKMTRLDFFLIIKFLYNNVKNASIGYIPFENNYDYYLHILYKEDIDS